MIDAAAAAASGRPLKLLTLLLVVQGDRVLLGMKKRGFGMGKYNGYGGKVEAGETVLEGALRELHEEAGIKATDATPRGRMLFEFRGEETVMDVRVFSASAFEGEPTESEEMTTEWFGVDKLPFDRMWADDRHWFPILLDGGFFRGYFEFEKDKIVDGVLERTADADTALKAFGASK
ncbi:hypothetical protein FNF28_05758 [Cafeteria roenbergensis]|nr:hypothetical protein FNF28_05758 [Cafeteria roenbergensis]